MTAKENTRKVRIKRLLVVMLFVVAIIALFLIGMKLIQSLDYKHWVKLSNKVGLMGPIAFFLVRIWYMFDAQTSFVNDIVDPNSLFNVLDKFTSGRLVLAKVFAERFEFMGTLGEGLMVGQYYAYTAHNAYVHAIYLYGIGGVMMIVFLLYSLVMSVVEYIKKHSTKWLFIISVLPMMLGLMLGEMLNFYYAVMFMTFIALRPVIIREDK